MQNSSGNLDSARVEGALDVRLEEFDARHLDEVLRIESTFAAPWTREMFQQELRQQEELAYGLVAVVGERVVGYALNWFVADEVHIVNLAVHPHCRRRGIARRLLGEVFDCARRRGMMIATLEVRYHNEAAISLYRSLGFREVALRKKYYADNGEDALVMLADLPA